MPRGGGKLRGSRHPGQQGGQCAGPGGVSGGVSDEAGLPPLDVEHPGLRQVPQHLLAQGPHRQGGQERGRGEQGQCRDNQRRLIIIIYGQVSGPRSCSASEYPAPLGETGSQLLAALTGHTIQLFDLGKDPGERTNLAAQQPDLAQVHSTSYIVNRI